jgi:signal transduction histidine kinase/CheY-like chemotaxis protein/ligand-binding sensor domain-containing protein
MREANSVCKDNNGFIWSSSKIGILRITEKDYRIYHLPYETANVINVKLIYQYSKLFAYTNNGQIFAYNPVLDRFDLLFNVGKILDNKYLGVNDLLIDDTGTYWIASSWGIYKYNSGQLLQIDNSSVEGYSMTWYDNQHILIARKEGIWLLDINTLKSKCIYENKSIPQITVSSLLFDEMKKKLWIGTISNGLLCYDFSSGIFSNKFKSSIPKQPILAIQENSGSSLLIGVDGQGIWELSIPDERVLNVYKESADDPSSLPGNGVYDLFCDQDKRVWVCTFSGGLSYFYQASPHVNQIVHHPNEANSLVNDNVNSIIEDRSGKLWFATNNGISCWNLTTNQWKNFYCNEQKQTQVFLSLCEDDQGRIWAGSYSSGVYILDGKTGQELAHYSKNIKGSPLAGDFILDIFKDSQSNIWLGGVGDQLACYNSKENTFRTYAKEPVISFAELSSSQILLGCSYGLALLDGQTGRARNLLLGILVHDILVLGDDLWICTSGDGLIRYNNKSGATEKFTTEFGLPSNFINSIVHDSSYLWLGTESGLCRFDPNDKSTRTFSSLLPLSGISYNAGSHYKLKNGQLAWGTNKGAVIFDPESITEVPSKGKIYFQNLTISGRSVRDISSFKLNTPVDSLQSVNLKYFQNTISLELLSIGMSAGSKFSWKMEGLDRDWTAPTDNKIITYTNIPSGKFVLRIRLYDNSLSHIINERSITIKLVPPFWRTGWFFLILFIVFSGIIFVYFLFYINSLKQKHTEEKVRFFTNTAHDIRTSLTLIKAPIEELGKELNLSEKGRNYLHLAISQARQLSTVVTQLMDFQKADIGKEQMLLSMVDIVGLISKRKLMFESFAKSKGIELSFASYRQSYITAIDESKIEKVIDNLISNAIKYSRSDSMVQLDLKCDDNKWVFQVKDRGIGINRKAQRQLFKEFYRGNNAINSKVVGSGIGLLLVKNYVNLHKGRVIFDSQENVGSTFQIVIPYQEVSNAEITANVLQDVEMDPIQLSDISLQSTSDLADPRMREMKVLLVEDNDDLLNFMHDALAADFNVFTADNGAKAWEFISKNLPDLVVSDVMMPHMDGFELCQIMKSTYETSHIPIILLTALSDKAKQLHGLGLGADDYLTKPFDMQLLTERIRSIIRNREAVREKALKMIKGDSEKPILANELNDVFVKKMLEVARKNISNFEFDKDKFASEMHVSSSLLYKKVKSFTGLSPSDFIRTVRLDYARELLQTNKYTVTEVSELCGFTNSGYFSTAFRKHFGKSPTQVI